MECSCQSCPNLAATICKLLDCNTYHNRHNHSKEDYHIFNERKPLCGSHIYLRRYHDRYKYLEYQLEYEYLSEFEEIMHLIEIIRLRHHCVIEFGDCIGHTQYRDMRLAQLLDCIDRYTA